MSETFRFYSALPTLLQGRDIPARDADTTIVTLSLGLAVIGKLLVIPEAAKELSVIDITSIGDLIATLSETLHALHQGVEAQS